MSDSTDALIRRVQWRSRRGMLELELLLLPFTQTQLAKLSDSQLQDYEALLECEDWDIFDWLQNRADPVDSQVCSIVDEIRRFLQKLSLKDQVDALSSDD